MCRVLERRFVVTEQILGLVWEYGSEEAAVKRMKYTINMTKRVGHAERGLPGKGG